MTWCSIFSAGAGPEGMAVGGPKPVRKGSGTTLAALEIGLVASRFGATAWGSPGALLANARRPLAFFDAKTLEGSRARLCKCHGASLPSTVQQRKPGGTPGDPAKPAAQEREWFFLLLLPRRGFALVLRAEASRGEFFQSPSHAFTSRFTIAQPALLPSYIFLRHDETSRHRRFQATTRRPVRAGRRVDFSGVWPHSFPPSFMDNTTLSDSAQASSASKRPLKTIREEDCSASIWPRTVTKNGSERTFYSVTIERRYKDKDGKFHYTKSFDAGSMSQLASVIQKTNDELQALQVGN